MQVLNRYKLEAGQTGLYIGRGTPLGNPYSTEEHGTREEVVALYEAYFTTKLAERDPELEQAFRKLQPSDNLICSCAPATCHGEVILAAYEEIYAHPSYEEGLKAYLQSRKRLLDPRQDGVSHLNIYSRASTLLGRALSNFSRHPFTMPGYGQFESIEGFWYWLATGGQHDKLRGLSGYDAKKVGKTFKRVERDDFQELVKEAVRIKLLSHPLLFQAFVNSTLPLMHYYWYGEPGNAAVVPVSSVGWLTRHLEYLRAEWKKISRPRCRLVIAGSRDFLDFPEMVRRYRDSGLWATEVVSGKARGTDRLGERLAGMLGVPVEPFPADWDKEPKRAGFIRNAEMGLYGDAGLLFILNNSSGSGNMLENLDKGKKPALVHDYQVGPYDKKVGVPRVADILISENVHWVNFDPSRDEDTPFLFHPSSLI